jgi:hypothetical protein
MPGDMVIAPGTHAYLPDVFSKREAPNTKGYLLKVRPFVVVARLDCVLDDVKATELGYGTFVLYTRHGILLTINRVAKEKIQIG